MRNSWLMVVLVFLVACQPAVLPQPNITTTTECNPPYYEYTKGDCCLDKNANGICDRDEPEAPGPVINKTTTFGPTLPLERTIMASVIAKFQENVTSYSYKQGKDAYFVMGKLVHVELGSFKELEFKYNNTIRTYITDIFIDRERQEAIGYCDPRTEEDIVGEFQADRSKCIKLINIPINLSYAAFNPRLPEDWLFRYADDIPGRIETNDQYVKEPSGWKSVNPVLFFVDSQNEIILKLDSKTGLPLKVEIHEPVFTKVETFDFFVHNSVKPQEVAYQPFHR